MAGKKMDGCKASTGLSDSSSTENNKRRTSPSSPLHNNGFMLFGDEADDQGTNIHTVHQNPSTKGNPNQELEIEETIMEAKKPRILRLFGVNIIIPDEADDQGTNVHTVYQNPSRKENPNQETDIEETNMETKKPRFLRLFGFDIVIPDEADQGTKVTVPPNPSRNPNSHEEEEEEEEEEVEEEEEEEAPVLIPPGFHPRVFAGIAQPPISMFEKELQCSDVSPNHNRLLITGSDKLMMALTEEERRKVEIDKGDYLAVKTSDTNGAVYTLHLKRWAGSGSIVLKREWSKFVAANNLQKGDTVKGWGYRVGDEFRLALIKAN